MDIRTFMYEIKKAPKMKVSLTRKIHIIALPQGTFLNARWSEDQSATTPCKALRHRKRVPRTRHQRLRHVFLSPFFIAWARSTTTKNYLNAFAVFCGMELKLARREEPADLFRKHIAAEPVTYVQPQLAVASKMYVPEV